MKFWFEYITLSALLVLVDFLLFLTGKAEQRVVRWSANLSCGQTGIRESRFPRTIIYGQGN